MKKALQLSIATPCQEKWGSFSTTSQGGFCGSCQKEVIDFTTWDEERIKTYFKSRPLHVCGRFRETQLKVYAVPQPLTTRPAWLPVLMAGIITVFTSRQVLAQTKSVQVTEQTQKQVKIGETEAKQTTAIHVTGVVKSLEDSTTIPGVNVILKGTATGTATDEDGAFSITLERATGNDVLVFSFIGLKSVEYTINSAQPVQNITIAMALDVTQLGDVVMMGGIHMRWYNPRRWWWGVRSLFRR
jgi:hypothetical protein